MTIENLLDALRGLDAQLYVADGQLRYAGPKLAAGDPIRRAIGEHRAALTELFTFAPGRRCVFTVCYRLVAEGSRVVCPNHQQQLGDSCHSVTIRAREGMAA